MKTSGLAASEAEKRLETFGPNDVEERKAGRLKRLAAPFVSPISLMLLGAALLSRLSGKIFDSAFIFGLYLVNGFIQKWQEFKADKAVEQLRGKLAFDVWTERDGAWGFVNARRLVPGDRVRLGLGSVIPADGTVVSCRNLTVNEAVLTGESMPKEKKPGDTVFSGTFIATGSLEAELTATGRRTAFGKTIYSIEPAMRKSALEKDVLSITRFLIGVSLIAVCILTAVFAVKGYPLQDLLTLDLSLVIAGIPVALPAVMAVILSIGAGRLAARRVIVRRLSALQDLANVDLLLTDKTGTLTRNEIKVANVVSYQEGMSTDEILELAAYATSADTPDQIEQAVRKSAEAARAPGGAEVLDFVPYDSERKRSTSVVRRGGERLLISMGAPQVIEAFDGYASAGMKEKFHDDIRRAASEGYRVLALAVRSDGTEEAHMRIVGLLFLADPLDESSKDVLAFMRGNGIGVKILTGDNVAITQRIVKELDLPGEVVVGNGGRFDGVAAFAQILPKDKYEIVKAAKERFTVAATGDGVNDLPALKIADVGIAVSRAVSALKSLADIVLLGEGLSVIKDAILEARKIFARLYNYSVYRISESFRLVVTILLLGIVYGFYPLQPLQLILLAFLNDVPIVSLAVDRVKTAAAPSKIDAKGRLTLSLLFGSIGTLNSFLLFVLMTRVLHLPLAEAQTIFFLKLTVSGHALIFVAHTKERWWRYLPSKEVIAATLGTQALATALAMTGFLMPARISAPVAALVWVWALFWMQVGELMKIVQARLRPRIAAS
jgi:H+-transporting ATPase